jgi:tripartite-type tricarboxylate transporter receptor subunit TctC
LIEPAGIDRQASRAAKCGTEMPLQRRDLLRRSGAAAIAAPTWRIAKAQDYPTRPVPIIEGLGGGSTPNLVARLTGQWLSEHLGQPFVVESELRGSGTK